MSYETYKILHLIFIVLFVASTISLLYAPDNKKVCRIFNGIFTFLIFVAGMGLIARIGISHSEPWPFWIKVKIALWLVASVCSALGAKRFPQHRHVVAGLFLSIVSLGVVTAVLK